MEKDDNRYLLGALLLALLDLGERGHTELHINNKAGEYILLAKNPKTQESIDLFNVQLDGLKELHEDLKGRSPADLYDKKGDIMYDTLLHALTVIVQRSVKPTDRPMVLAELIEDVLTPLDLKEPIALHTGALRESLENSIADTYRAIALMTAFSGKESDNND